MAVMILEGVKVNEDDERRSAVFYCGTSGLAFGPLMDDAEEAEAFLQWLTRRGRDPRKDSERLVEELEEFRGSDPMEPLDESMDGDHESALASAGFGTDEDYGYYGGDED
jgi:hypothetical protein